MEEKIEKTLDQHVLENGTAGQVVGVIDGEYSKVFVSGYKDLETKELLTGDELFSIGSVSKTFTALLLSIAESKGYLNEKGTKSKVKDYLSELEGYPAGEITLESLAIHTSGLPRSPEVGSSFDPYKDYTKASLIKQLKDIEKLEAGNYSYSNFGYALLGLCLEKIFNQDFSDATKNEILSPLKISDFYVSVDDTYLERIPPKYNQVFEKLPVWKNLGAMNPAGSFKATAIEMLKYAKAVMNPKATTLEKELIKASKPIFTKKDGSKRSLSFEILSINGEDYLFHNGYTLGFITNLYISQKYKKVLLQMSASDTITPCIPAIFFKASTNCKTAKFETISKEEQVEYIGTYADIDKEIPESIKNINIRASSYGFMIWDRGNPLRLYPASKDQFIFSDERLGSLSVKFERDETGEISSLKLIDGTKVSSKADKL